MTHSTPKREGDSVVGDLRKAALVIGWGLVQGALILTAGARPEHAFGFRMFSEASSLSYSLFRQVRAEDGSLREEKCEKGRYTLVRAGQAPRVFDWHDWVKTPGLGTFDRDVFASYGLEAQRSRLEAALRSFAEHVPADDQTVRFVIRGESSYNGAPRERFELRSAERLP